MAPPGRARLHPRPLIRRSIRLFGALACASLAGCAWVGPGEVEDKLDSLDHDGDGAPYGGPPGVRDCDDFDPDVAPGLPDIPYDGIDNDCGGDGDLIDVDGDGYAGITREAYLKRFPDATWPSTLPPDAVDCVDDPDDHPMARHVHPNASDAPYDGVDADCAGDDDFDADGDGFLPERFERGGQLVDTAPEREAYAEAWGYELPEAVFGDCNDLDASVHPEVPLEDDAPYDGHDSNCDGLNDFDLDGDGFMPDGFTEAYDLFVQTYHRGTPPWGEAGWGDCLDAPDPARFDGDPAEVHPEAEEVPYDGVDGDCDGANDFDVDGDGFMPDLAPGYPNHAAFVDAFRAYDTAWGGGFAEAWGDCDDTEPLSYPGALERWGDAIDADCDGGANTTALVDAGHTWTDPRRPVLVGTDARYVLTASATGVDLAAPIGVQYDEVALSLTFPRTSGTGATPSEHLVWLFQQNPNDPRPVQDALAVLGEPDGFWAAVAFGSANADHVRARRYTWDAVAGAHSLTGTVLLNANAGPGLTGLDLTVDALDLPWITACDGARVLARRAAQAVQPFEPTPSASDVCLVDGPPQAGAITIHTDGAAGRAAVAYDEPSISFSPAGSAAWPSSVVEGRARDGWFQLVDAADGAWLVRADGVDQHHLFGGWSVASFDADWKDGLIWAAAVVFDPASGRHLVKAGWADPAVDADQDGDPDLHLVDWPLSDPAFYAPRHVALLADADRLVLAVTESHASDPDADRVAWAFVGW